LKPGEVRDMTVDEIEDKLLALKEQLFKMRAEMVTGRVERPSVFSILKKDIARCHTILKEKKGEVTKTS
jgi:large subunit ribosomal protein L29